MVMKSSLSKIFMVASAIVFSSSVFAHGNVSPQAVDVSALPAIGEEWVEENPYRNEDDSTLLEEAVKIGKSAFNQNCARCHGLGGVSGGIAPDLRENLTPDAEGDEWFMYRIRNGAERNGITYMPKFEGIIAQEAMWALKSWLDTCNPEVEDDTSCWVGDEKNSCLTAEGQCE